jgi:hypothetical protein
MELKPILLVHQNNLLWDKTENRNKGKRSQSTPEC